jgi:hypothetical protein
MPRVWAHRMRDKLGSLRCMGIHVLKVASKERI